MNKKFEYVDDNPGSYFGMLVESVEDRKELKESIVGNAKNWLIYKEGKSPKETEKILNSLNPEEIEEIALKWLKQRKLKEDKFVPQDKMSKKAQKELNNKKRGTWGNTKPVTRVQPNKKAYDRKRDSKVVDERLDKQSDFELTYVLDEIEELSNYYRSRQDNWSNEDSEEFLRDMNDILHRTQHLFRKAKVLEESKKLNESSDGWDESKLYDLSEILDEIYNLQYEVQNTIRGAYTNAHTYEELGYYVHNLGSNLMDIGDEIMEIEEEDDEDED